MGLPVLVWLLHATITGGGVGIAPNIQILPVKTSNDDGLALTEDIAEAIKYAADNADVLSCSWGYEPLDDPNDVIHKAIQTATSEGRGEKGCPVFFATGNDASGFMGSINVTLNPGTYTYRWEFIRDNANDDGDNCVWLDNIIFPDGNVEDFENGIPAGWTTGGNADWIEVNDNRHYYYGLDANSVQSGPIGHNQTSWIETVRQHSNTGLFSFAMWPSTEVQRTALIYDPNKE